MMRSLNSDLSELATLMYEAMTDQKIDSFHEKFQTTSAPYLYQS